MTVGIDDKLVAQHIAHEAQPVLAVVVIDVAVDLVLVDALGQQLADDEVDVWLRRVIGEAARIGHHATIHGTCEVLALLLEES